MEIYDFFKQVLMDIAYISDSDPDDQLDDYISIKSDEGTVDSEEELEPDDLDQPINYPPLEKHSAIKIVSICNEIDLIDIAISSYVEPVDPVRMPKSIDKSKWSDIKLKTKAIHISRNRRRYR